MQREEELHRFYSVNEALMLRNNRLSPGGLVEALRLVRTPVSLDYGAPSSFDHEREGASTRLIRSFGTYPGLLQENHTVV